MRKKSEVITWHSCWCQICWLDYFRVWEFKQSGWGKIQWEFCGGKCCSEGKGQTGIARVVPTATHIATRYTQGLQGEKSCLKSGDWSYTGVQVNENWTMEDFTNIAWSEESWFLLWHSDCRVRIWGKQHENIGLFCIQCAQVLFLFFILFLWQTKTPSYQLSII